MENVLPQLARALELLKNDSTCSEAEQEFAKASKASLETFGENNIITARTLAHLARVCASRDKVDVAVAMYERILRIHEALPVPSNSDHAMALLELATLKETFTDDDPDRLCLRVKADQIMEEIAARAQESSSHTKSPPHSRTTDEEGGVLESPAGRSDSRSSKSSSSSSTASSSRDESETYRSDVDGDDENLEENCEGEDDGTKAT